MASDEYVPGLEGIPAAKSQIGFIDGERGILEYRGIRIEELAAHSNFLETAYLLIEGYLPNEAQLAAFTRDVASQRTVQEDILSIIRLLPPDGHPMDALQACVAILGMSHPSRDVDDTNVAYEVVTRLIGKLPTLVAAFHRARRGEEPIAPRDDLEHAANFLYMLTGTEPDPLVARTFDTCLLLHAEHTLNVSTFTTRVAGSTLANPYSVISAAIGALSGPLHGGANEHVIDMLREIGSVGNVRPFIGRKIERGERIMGVGHRLYKVKDPRVPIIQNLVKQPFEKGAKTPLYDIAEEVERVVFERLGEKGIHPNVDFYSGIAYERMGIPQELFTVIFAVARVVGWLAHWREQLSDNRIFRPTHIYTGDHNRPYLPITERP